MLDFEALNAALAVLGGSLDPWLVIVPGLVIGLVGGAIPGLSTSITMAIFLPFALYMDFLSAVLFLTSIFTGGGFGGAIPAILMNVPGTTAAVSTTFDGYPMARSGRHNEALGLALSSSCIGVLAGYLLMLFLLGTIAELVLKLGPPEMFLIMFCGLTMIAVLGSASTSKALIAGLLGILISTVGMSPQGHLRGTLGLPQLLDGVSVVPAMIGLLAIPELLKMSNSNYIVQTDRQVQAMNLSKLLKGFALPLSFPGILLRGSLIGVLIGAVPGVGSSIANLISYSEVRRTSKDKDSFGKGNPKGVIAAESANSSSEGGALITLLTLGIPGGAGTAILLAAFTMHNITGGPRFVEANVDVVYTILLGNIAQAILLVPVGFLFIYLCSAIVKVPLRALLPVILSLIVFGCYSINGSVDGPITLLVFGLLGYLLDKFGFSLPAMVVGLLLGRLAEGELLRAYQLTQGRLDLILTRPITLILLALMIGAVLQPIAREWWRRRAASRHAQQGETR